MMLLLAAIKIMLPWRVTHRVNRKVGVLSGKNGLINDDYQTTL